MSKVYVASAFCNKAETRAVQAALIAAGHTVSHDWTTEDASHLEFKSPAYFEYLERCGENDLRGIINSTAVVVIAHEQMRDTLCEMGLAIGFGVPVYVLNPERRHSVFYSQTTPVAGVTDLLSVLENA